MAVWRGVLEILTVDLGERSYPIYIGTQLLTQADLLTPHIRGQQVAIVTNETIAPLYLPTLRATLSGYTITEIILPDGEAFKDLPTLNKIFDQLLADRYDRTCTLIALGGGVVGDTTGFAAACYLRGVDFIQVPTTLLSQVDSSVGGKTGVNHALGKNMIGAFWQPQCVVADVSTLATLSDREFASGLAEVIKYGLIADEAFFLWLEQNSEQLLKRNEALLIEAVLRSCQNKADVVAEDEHEAGKRAILNFGHTFGHAIESHLGYGHWLHGEAVAAGMTMATDLSVRAGWIDASVHRRVKQLLKACSLPTKPPKGITPAQFMTLMSVDKKCIGGRLRLVLLKALGKAVVTADYPESHLAKLLQELCH